MGPKTRILVAIVLFAVLIFGGYIVSQILFADNKTKISDKADEIREDEDEHPGKDDTESVTPRISVISVRGEVRRQETGSDWVVVKQGDELGIDEALSASEEANAVVDIGNIATVKIAPQSEVRVKDVKGGVSTVRLEKGRISAVVQRSKGGKLAVEASGSDAVAETTEGEFSLLTDGKGFVSVATHEGRVRFSAKSKSIEVTAGMQSVAEKDQPPRASVPIPKSLFLKVAKPAKMLRKRETVIEGSTSPGAVINVRGVRIVADAEGNFKGMIPLAEGKNEVVVEAEDALGRRESVSVPDITVDTKPPKAHSEIRWGKRRPETGAGAP